VRSASNRLVGRDNMGKNRCLMSAPKKKNLPCLRTRARLRGSNEGGQLVLHIAVGGFDAAVRDRAVLRGLHGGPK